MAGDQEALPCPGWVPTAPVGVQGAPVGVPTAPVGVQGVPVGVEGALHDLCSSGLSQPGHVQHQEAAGRLCLHSGPRPQEHSHGVL